MNAVANVSRDYLSSNACKSEQVRLGVVRASRWEIGGLRLGAGVVGLR